MKNKGGIKHSSHKLRLNPKESPRALTVRVCQLQVLIDKNSLDVEVLSREKIPEWLSLFNQKEL